MGDHRQPRRAPLRSPDRCKALGDPAALIERRALMSRGSTSRAGLGGPPTTSTIAAQVVEELPGIAYRLHSD